MATIADPKALTNDQLRFRLELFGGVVGTLSKRITPTERRILAALLHEAAERLSNVVEPADEWCREESCRYRHWRSGSMPTHKRGSECPPVSSRTGGD